MVESVVLAEEGRKVEGRLAGAEELVAARRNAGQLVSRLSRGRVCNTVVWRTVVLSFPVGSIGWMPQNVSVRGACGVDGLSGTTALLSESTPGKIEGAKPTHGESIKIGDMDGAL